jgi:hypothetical protein
VGERSVDVITAEDAEAEETGSGADGPEQVESEPEWVARAWP